MAPTVTAIDRVLSSGSSFPSLVQTTTGFRYVLKLSNAGPGTRALATEFVALKLARAIGLRAPDAQVLQVPRELPWQVGTDEFYEAVQRSVGANLGVAFIADARDVTAGELTALPVPFLDRLTAVDALLQNVDRTAANPNIVRDAAGEHWAIDFGACLLIDRLARGAIEPRSELPSNHFLARHPAQSRCLRQAAMRSLGSDLEAIIDALPNAWLSDLTLSCQTLLQRLRDYLQALVADGNGKDLRKAGLP